MNSLLGYSLDQVTRKTDLKEQAYCILKLATGIDAVVHSASIVPQLMQFSISNLTQQASASDCAECLEIIGNFSSTKEFFVDWLMQYGCILDRLLSCLTHFGD